MELAGLDIDQFLADHWQKRPVLIRNPWKDWRNPLEPDELAGLACEESIEARLIVQYQGKLVVEAGPLPETRFGELAGGPWTVLVQAVDHYVDAVAALIESFRFVPNWRIDDIMVSYATDGGGVGPHFDNYDVFLIQGTGRRRWRVGPRCSSETPMLPHEDLRLLAEFDATEEWILEPGDILYVPPLFAHDGVAVGDDCMTYSIGFRAPSRAELIDGWCEHQADALLEEDRYADPDLKPQANPGEITTAAIDRLHAMAIGALSDRDAFARWFGHYNSLPKYADTDWRPEEPLGRAELHGLLTEGAVVYRNPASRFSFIREARGIILFVDGQSFECAGDAAMLAEHICADPAVKVDPSLAASEAALTLLAGLIDQGSLTFDGED